MFKIIFGLQHLRLLAIDQTNQLIVKQKVHLINPWSRVVQLSNLILNPLYSSTRGFQNLVKRNIHNTLIINFKRDVYTYSISRSLLTENDSERSSFKRVLINFN